MNRLVIIGNGFDLAHGLPTKYGDFIEAYFIEAVTVFIEEREYVDDLISMKYISSINFTDLSSLNSLKNILKFFQTQKHYVELSYNSIFFGKLIEKLEELNWVDVENEYFEELKSCNFKVGGFDFKKVSKVNTELNFIKGKLEKYLVKTVKDNRHSISPNKYSRSFSDLILKEEVLLKKLENDIHPNNIHVLNFNYTSTIEVTVDNIRNIPCELNYIHGELKNTDNPLIFGFGDEYDKDYRDFEDKKNNILFEHIKSFGYFKTLNYHRLIRFLESDDYQVYIIGHSCGLSDRTMLKEIFENEKCKSIKIFYYQKSDMTNDYVEKTMEISRHFEDKGLMRKKIVPFPLSKKM